MASPGLRDGISRGRALIAAAFVALAVAAVALADEPIGPALVASLALASALIVANAVDAFRTHRLHTLATTAVLAILFALWWASTGGESPLAALLTATTVVGVLVETYNLRNGTSYLRLDL